MKQALTRSVLVRRGKFEVPRCLAILRLRPARRRQRKRRKPKSRRSPAGIDAVKSSRKRREKAHIASAPCPHKAYLLPRGQSPLSFCPRLFGDWRTPAGPRAIHTSEDPLPSRPAVNLSRCGQYTQDICFKSTEDFGATRELPIRGRTGYAESSRWEDYE